MQQPTADTSTDSPRDYRLLFRAMNKVLRALSAGTDAEDALRRSFEDVAEGFRAEKALLLLVEDGQPPLRLRCLHASGLTDAQIQACERSESVDGVSSSVIRAQLKNPRMRIIPNPLLSDAEETPALVGHNYAVLCGPVQDALQGLVLAVMYFQTSKLEREHTYGDADAAWLEGYASAVGHAFSFHLQRQRRENELKALLEGRTPPEDAPEIIGDSADSRALRRELHEIHIPASEAADPDPLLILGAKGTGKDLVARYLYAYSGRRAHSFVVVNCAEITDELAAARFFGHKKGSFTGALSDEMGFFRAAHRGVLFLDEIAELSLKAQATLLRVLENRTVVPVGETKEIAVDVQVVLATNRDPERSVAEGVLKADLYDRFKTNAVRLQPLQHRPWDIPLLIQHYIAHHERRVRKRTAGLTADALRVLVSYSWPGNVREVARVCSVLVTYAKPGAPLDQALLARCVPDVLHAPPNPRAGPVLWEDVPLRDALRAFERELILSRLERHHWNVRLARESLGLPKTTFQRYAAALGITIPGGGRNPGASVAEIVEE